MRGKKNETEANFLVSTGVSVAAFNVLCQDKINNTHTLMYLPIGLGYYRVKCVCVCERMIFYF